ncbi:MAG: hypothetical protein HQL14_07720 [Candidatus Omnitrophica bacterium]|nr:hypothetical protein [Candidatus Omnitrophota bacterium]
MEYKLVIIFKFIEPLFWFAQAVIIINLLKPMVFFERNIKVLNWLLGYQGFDSRIQVELKAFKIWYRDLWILFFLNPLIIVLIHLI